MKIAIMQPYVFPYIGYFQLIGAVDKFVFFDDVNFIKKGYINHNSILINGNTHRFTIPCKNVSQNKLIKDVAIDFDDKTRLKFLKTIDQAYKKAPYFNEVFTMLENFLEANTSTAISDFCIESIQIICNYLSIEKEWVLSSKRHNDSKQLQKELRLIEICKKENSNTYINPIGGMKLYEKNDFETHGINLSFLKSASLEYKQFENDFVPSLSIIDVLMFNSIEEIQQMLNEYELI